MKKISLFLLMPMLLIIALTGLQAQQITSVQRGAPSIVIDPMEVTFFWSGGQQILTKTVLVTNEGSEPLTFDIFAMQLPGAGPDVVVDPEFVAGQYALRAALQSDPNSERAPGSYFGNEVINSDADYDLQFEYACGDASGEAGIETDGNFFYTTKWNGSGFFKYHIDGTFLGAFQVGTVNAIRDLAYDGTYFYGGAAATTVYIMDFNTNTLIGQFTAPVAVRAIAYDYGEEGFWANNWSTTLTLFNQSGVVLNTIPTQGEENFYGLAFDPQGPYLWGYSQRTGTSQNILYKYALPSGQFLLEFDVFPLLSLVTTGDIAGGLAFHMGIELGLCSLVGLVQNKCIWVLEVGVYSYPPSIDVGVQSIVSPTSGVSLGNEQIVIKVRNNSYPAQSNIPWSVTWSGQGSGSISGIYTDTLAPWTEVEITAGSVNMSAYGTYVFEACTNMDGDEFPLNDCKTKVITCLEPGLCVDNLYTTGCSLGDGLTSWNLGYINIDNIPCAGNPPWYQNYMDQIHELYVGETYVLSVTAGYADTYIDVWIDYDNDLEFNNNEELVLNDAVCTFAGTAYTFNITTSPYAPPETCAMRVRTNYWTPVTGPCETYTYGNCIDFKADFGCHHNHWLTAEPPYGTIAPGASTAIAVTFNSYYYYGGEGLLNFNSNDPLNPLVEVPVYVLPDLGCPYPFPENLDLSIIYGDTTFATVTWELNALKQITRSTDGLKGRATTRHEKSGELLGFDIIRDDTLIATLIQEFSYTDTILPYYLACYKVAAHYDDCTVVSEEMVCIPVSVAETADETEIKVYPNPARDLLHIAATGIKEITIQAILGKLVYNQMADKDNLQINTIAFSKGIYIITVRTEQTTYTEKLIIQ
ncbi:MAG: T9SS type A sorting domain-containing protein [Bacteroidales bacterium]|nr:T9SS type A sorting domain-containing protein [Bacteroidales bacterium]